MRPIAISTISRARPLEETLKASRAAGVSTIITIAVSPDNLERVLEIANSHSDVFCTQGIHPHEAKHYNDAVQAHIKKNLKQKKVVAVGEIGLDYHYDNSPRDKQKAVFRDQLSIAVENNRPVVIHTRDADQDTAEILTQIAPRAGAQRRRA